MKHFITSKWYCHLAVSFFPQLAHTMTLSWQRNKLQLKTKLKILQWVYSFVCTNLISKLEKIPNQWSCGLIVLGQKLLCSLKTNSSRLGPWQTTEKQNAYHFVSFRNDHWWYCLSFDSFDEVEMSPDVMNCLSSSLSLFPPLWSLN